MELQANSFFFFLTVWSMPHSSSYFWLLARILLTSIMYRNKTDHYFEKVLQVKKEIEWHIQRVINFLFSRKLKAEKSLRDFRTQTLRKNMKPFASTFVSHVNSPEIQFGFSI